MSFSLEEAPPEKVSPSGKNVVLLEALPIVICFAVGLPTPKL